MQLSLTYYSPGVTISFCKFWFENNTLMQVRYCHLLGIWCVFVVHILFSSFFDSAHDDICWYISKDISMYFGFKYTSDYLII